MGKRSVQVIAIIFIVLCIDQALKIWVKTHMEYGDQIMMFGQKWALIHFVENDGMAFGITLGVKYGKLILSLFRITAVGFLIYYIRLLLRSEVSFNLLFSFALILAGALGNIFDSAFYGLIFSASFHGEVSQLFPQEGGYAPFLYGKVVDMLYFPIFRLTGYYPSWLPFIGDNYYSFEFFKPVFNIADVSITTGVMNILLFQRDFFSSQKNQQAPEVVEGTKLETAGGKEAQPTPEETDEESGAEKENGN